MPVAVLLLVVSLTALQAAPTLCPEKMGSYPIVEADRSADPHFEIRRCQGSVLQVAGFRAGEERPSLLIDTGQGAVSMVIHTGGILLVQLVAGSSSPTDLFQIRQGKPVLVERISGVGGVSYREEHPRTGSYAVLSIPLKTYPDADGKWPNVPPRVFRLKIHDN